VSTLQQSELSVPRAGRAQTVRNFALVGAVGFAIEAILLTALTQLAGWAPWQARIPSFLSAVLATWALNRRHTFAGRGLARRSVEAFSYVLIQVCGAAINLAVFGLCLMSWPDLHRVPVVALAIGAVAGFIFNFGASNTVLYARRRGEVQQ
jgi:putative flippase GtrA